MAQEHINSLERDKFYRNLAGEVVVRTSATGDFRVSGLVNGGLVTSVELNDTTWTALPPIPLLERNALAIQNLSGQDIKVNYSVTAASTLGVTIANYSDRFYDISDSIPLYGICASGTCSIIIEEIS